MTAKGPNNYFRLFDHNIYCSVCGRMIKFSEAKKHWQGQWRCSQCWEPRHPQDFVMPLPRGEMKVEVVQKEADNDVIAPAWPDSGVGVVNSFTTAVTVFIYPEGALITEITINGVAQSLTASKYNLPAGETIIIDWAGGYPQWAWVSNPE